MICCMLEKGLLKYTWFCNYNLLELILELWEFKLFWVWLLFCLVTNLT
jgi:hypothetical protein